MQIIKNSTHMNLPLINNENGHLSSLLMDGLRSNPIIIDGDTQKLVLLSLYLETVLNIGITEHTGDWDPYLRVELTDGSIKETHSGYTEIIFGDFSDEENGMPDVILKNHEEITTVGFYFIEDNDDQAEQPEITFIAISSIKSITAIE